MKPRPNLSSASKSDSALEAIDMVSEQDTLQGFKRCIQIGRISCVKDKGSARVDQPRVRCKLRICNIKYVGLRRWFRKLSKFGVWQP